ncbi:MAG: baseplate J/gp47 family protein [Leptospiraceae bacterium]|nr:baseplate J/gp47 family protein [Leptospiraceae bacterium]
MADYGATSIGFVRKTEEVQIAELEDKAREPAFFGPDADLSPYSPIGVFIRLMSYALSENWKAFESNYYGSYLDTANGIELDRLGKFAGIPRKQAQTEKVVLTFSGSDSVEVPSGYLIQTSSGVLYRTIESKTIAGGTADVQSESDLVGTVSRVTSGQLTEIVTPLVGIDSVTNSDASSGGSLLESDGDYRDRILNSVGFIKNSGAVDYLKIKLEEAEFIQSIYIEENNKPIEYNGLPANSLAFTVLGGTDSEVAELIYKYKPAGVQTVGDTTVAVPTGFGDTVDINFSRPSYLDIYIEIEVETETGWVAENISLLKTAIVKYIGGIDTVDTVDTEYSGLGIGEDVVAWRSYSYMRDIPGIKNLNILFGTAPSPIDQTGITVATNQIATTLTANIGVSTI